MPRNPNNSSEFVAGMLLTVTFKKKKYFVDGRLQELRNVKDFMDKISCDEFLDNGEKMFSEADNKIINYEFFGVK